MKPGTIICLILTVSVMGMLYSCAPPPVVEEETVLTPEQQKALADSLREAQTRELKIIRSFAYSHYNNKNYAEAARYYAELAEKDTGHVFNDYGKWAQSYIQMNVSADSVKMVYEKGLLAFPEDAYLHASLGHIYRTQGMLDSAVVHYEAAVKYNPEEIEYRKTLAELYTRVNHPLQAIELYRKILEEEPGNKEVSEILADLIRRNLSLDDYINSLEEAVQRFPDDTQKKFDLAKAYTDAGQNEKARDLLLQITQVEPNNVRALEALGNVQENLRNYPAAIQACSKILEIEPDNAQVMVSISNCYRQMEDYPRARYYARKAMGIDSRLGSAYVALASIYEAAADKKTQGKPPTYYDKLVYTVAYGLYRDAKNTGDYSVMEDANRRMRYLKDSKLVPEYADWFMHQNDKDPTAGGGYDWIKPNWPELRFIETFLNEVSQK